MPAIAILGTQWGDEGKGKLTDLLSEQMDVVVRCTGGDNAGHTLVVGDETYKLRLTPSGILYDHIRPVIGNGVVVNPKVLIEELEMLEGRGIDTSRLRISGNAHLVMPYHLEIDKVSERFLGKYQLGTTKKGIGPTYADKAMRTGIRMQDIFDARIFRKKVDAALKDKNQILTKIYNRLPLDLDEIMDEYLGYAARLSNMVGDTALLLHRQLEAGHNVLLEGAQGALLDLDHGTYPFVTSSNPVASGMCTGAGLGPRAISSIIGITKAYSTRVGTGPFPTELEDDVGAYLGSKGAEVGTVTGRSRRCGWFDGVLFKYSARLNTLSSIALTKLDVLSGLPTIKVCTSYEYLGERYDEIPFHQSIVHRAVPVYETLSGWDEEISDVREFRDLPRAAQDYVSFIEELGGVPVELISVGPERDQTLERKPEEVGS